MNSIVYHTMSPHDIVSFIYLNFIFCLPSQVCMAKVIYDHVKKKLAYHKNYNYYETINTYSLLFNAIIIFDFFILEKSH